MNVREMSPPYEIEYDPPDDTWVKPRGIETPRSMRTMRRDFTFISTWVSPIREIKVDFYLHKKSKFLIGGIETLREIDNAEAFETILFLEFKSSNTLVNVPPYIDETLLLQVNKVHTLEKWRGVGLAMFAYATLAEMGYIILSDEDQYTAGKALWKSMAAKAKLSSYTINIINTLSGYLTDRAGRPIAYDARNIDDAQIWTKNNDFSGRYILLLLRKK